MVHTLQTSKNLLNETQQKLIYGRDEFVTSEDMFIKYEIADNIIHTLKHIVNELGENENDLQKHASTLRFTLEALINTKLLIAENVNEDGNVKKNDYFLKLYYSIYRDQVEKMEIMISRLENEIETLKKYSKLYEDNQKELKIEYADNPKEFIKEDERILQIYKNMAKGNNINIFLGQLDELGFHGLIDRLENNTLKIYTQELEKHKTLMSNKADELANEEWFNEYIDVNQEPSKVFNSLKDMIKKGKRITHRSWADKARAVGLEDEYKLNYGATSSLLHFTSYSLFTPNKISDMEVEYNYMILNQYIKKICMNLSALTKVILYDIFSDEIQVE